MSTFPSADWYQQTRNLLNTDSNNPLLIRPIEREGESEWDAYVNAHPRGTIYHTIPWRRVIERAFGHPTFWLAGRDSVGQIVGVLPLVRLKSFLFGDYLVSLPFVNYGGALTNHPRIWEDLFAHAGELGKQLGCSHVEFRDDIDPATSCPTRRDKVVMELDLPDEADVLFKAVGSKLRPSKEQATVHHGREELLDDFYKVFSRNMRDLGTPVYGRSFFRHVLGGLPDTSRIIVVRHHETPVAAGLLIHHRGRVEIPWASSIRSYNRIGVNMLLYWEALKSSIQAGETVFDFGRSTPDSGTFRFKEQWGASPRQLFWHYWLPEGADLPGLTPDNPKFRIAINIWKRLPVAVTQVFGPRIVRNLP